MILINFKRYAGKIQKILLFKQLREPL